MIMNQNIIVDIVLAAHNGGKFIEAQIYSILEQSHKSFNLIVTDDGSFDDTVDIVNAISEKDSRVSCHICNNAKGVIQNFNHGIQFSKSDYIFFSDQDDVWERNKVEVMLNEIIKHEQNNGIKVPCLGFSNLKIVDEDLNVIDQDFYNFSHLDPHNNMRLEYLVWRSSVYGCTTIMNSTLLKIAGNVPENIAMHDHWYAFQAALHGNIFYSPLALVNYRQHSGNVVGAHQRSLSARTKRARKTLSGIQRSVRSARIMMGLLKYKDAQYRLSFNQKINFVRFNVLPYFNERPTYATIFSILWLING